MHCVDDMISCERLSTSSSSFQSWRAFAALCGWDVPDSKSPPPSRTFTALGGEIHLETLPHADAFITITADRAKALRNELKAILKDNFLTSGHAARVHGRLGFAATQLYGRLGRAKLRPFVRRQYESGRTTVNIQMESALKWWLKELCHIRPRQVPRSLATRTTIVSYSDGEGAGACVGVALWDPRLPRPLAGILTVPANIRELWRDQKEISTIAGSDQGFNDIFEIEAIGPLLLLHDFCKVFTDCLWIHFIDNSAALACLVRGSSSVQSGDRIVGHTWSLVHMLRVCPWFDRVESKANPVDGLSRGVLGGPWGELQELHLPTPGALS